MNKNADNQVLIKLGLLIKQLRLEKKMSQETLAYSANVSLSQVSRIELGKHNTTFLTLLSICKALNVTTSYFFEEFELSQTLHDNKLKLNIDLKPTN